MKLILTSNQAHFLYKTKNAGQKLIYLKNQKSFKGKIKSIFHHF